MANTLGQRCAKYEWKLRHGHVCRAKDCAIEEQVEQFRLGQERNIRLTDQVRDVLCAEGVPPMLFPLHDAFALYMDRCRSRLTLSGEALAVEASIQIGVRVSRGLTQSVLETIRIQVFDIGQPTP